MKRFSGVLTAIVAPFNKGSLDILSFERLVQDQLQKGIQGFVVNGTTGESPTVTTDEHRKLFESLKKIIPKNMPIIYGTGTNSTVETIAKTNQAASLGADAALVVVPYYNKPPQRGLLQHFTAIAEDSPIPIILYNVPSRTIAGLEAQTIAELSKHPKIIGIKEATGNIEFAKQIRHTCGNEFLLLSGDDGTYDKFMAAGGDGVISVASHIIPEAMLKRDTESFRTLIDLLFCEANPIPVKMALFLMGLIQSPELRLPLVALEPKHTETLRKEMQRKGVLK